LSALKRAQRLLDQAHPQSYHEEDGKIIVRSYQDVEPHLDYAAACRREDAESRGTFGKRGEFRRTMVIPFNIMLGIAQRLGIPQGSIFASEHSKRILRELRGAEYKRFRTVSDRRI
jgi:hypothetical protein